MNREKLKLFILELLLIVILFFALNILSRNFLALILGIYSLIVVYLLKKRKIISINKKQATIMMIIFALFYLGLFYLLGLHFGFLKSKIILSFSPIFKFILHISVVIISSEVIRRIFLSYELIIQYRNIRFNLSPLLTYISMIIIDLLIYTEVYDLSNLDDFLTVLGFVFFASLSCNLLYNYITNRYGSKGIIIYRLITVLFIYVLPVIPDVYIFFRSFLRMLYPYIIYLIFEKLFSKNDYIIPLNEKKKAVIANTFLIIIAALLVMLISCQFKYGILVVGSHSMSSEINKGDAVIFENYKNQFIENGQVIIFDYNNIQTIHRVIEIKQVNGEIRYYTKGDANKSKDDEYRTANDIVGLVKLKVKYIGYPTIWLRSIFE